MCNLYGHLLWKFRSWQFFNCSGRGSFVQNSPQEIFFGDFFYEKFSRPSARLSLPAANQCRRNPQFDIRRLPCHLEIFWKFQRKDNFGQKNNLNQKLFFCPKHLFFEIVKFFIKLILVIMNWYCGQLRKCHHKIYLDVAIPNMFFSRFFARI